MTNPKSSKRKLLIIAAAALAALAIIAGPSVMDAAQQAFLNFFPDLKSVYTAERAAFPGRTIGVSKNTHYYSSGGTTTRQELYSISLIDSKKPTPDDVQQLGAVACQALNGTAATQINLAGVERHGWGMFSFTTATTLNTHC